MDEENDAIEELPASDDMMELFPICTRKRICGNGAFYR